MPGATSMEVSPSAASRRPQPLLAREDGAEPAVLLESPTDLHTGSLFVSIQEEGSAVPADVMARPEDALAYSYTYPLRLSAVARLSESDGQSRLGELSITNNWGSIATKDGPRRGCGV
jgi:hypothetical protein